MQSQSTLRVLLPLAIGLLLLTGVARAQFFSKGPETDFWVGAGMGYGSVPKADFQENVGLTLNATYQSGRHLLSARSAYAGEYNGEALQDYALLYGRAISVDLPRPRFTARFTASVAAGAGYVNAVVVYEAEGSPTIASEYGDTVGLALEAQSFVRLSVVGVGVYGFANVNPEASFLGATLSLQLGRLR